MVDVKFKEGVWNETINVRDFVVKNITPYYGNHEFLVGPSERTNKLWEVCKEATKEERQKGSWEPRTLQQAVTQFVT